MVWPRASAFHLFSALLFGGLPLQVSVAHDGLPYWVEPPVGAC